MTFAELVARRAALRAEIADLTRHIQNARARERRRKASPEKRQASIERVKAWGRANPERLKAAHRAANRAWYARKKALNAARSPSPPTA